MNFLNNLFNKNNIKVFEKFASEKTINKIVALNIRNPDSQKHYIQDTPNLIKKVINKKWAFPPSSGICRGGYDYSITFFENEKPIAYSLLCFECNSLTFQSECYEIQKSNINDILNSTFSPLFSFTKEFKDKETGQEFWSSVKNKKEIVILENQIPMWLRYDGEFWVSITVDKSIAYHSKKSAPLLQQKLKEFDSTENFSFSYIGMSGNEEKVNHMYLVSGSKALYEKTEGLDKINWKEYNEFKLPIFSKTSSPLD